MRNATPTQSVEKLLRALFEGTASDGPWVAHNGIAWEMEELAYHEPLDMLVPYQYLLLTLASDEARAATRQTAQAVRAAADRLLALLETYEQAAAGEHPEWAKFIALLEAPFPVEIPPNCDTRDPDVIAVMLRDTRFEGSWEKNLEWMTLCGSGEQQRLDGTRIRQLAAFEEAYGVNLADLLFSEQAKGER
ncbi:MAG: hypothetical protein E3J21_09095 [Anaerolineales bacterium]|nr:MAG: hypothetical protein E3J21_09095 [Anaerolineales bacterium]